MANGPGLEEIRAESHRWQRGHRTGTSSAPDARGTELQEAAEASSTAVRPMVVGTPPVMGFGDAKHDVNVLGIFKCSYRIYIYIFIYIYWKDIQTWAKEQWGILPGPTCCQVSRKDYVDISPGLQSLLKSCSNTFDKFPDHSTLVGLFDFPSKPAPIARWPKPQSIDYAELALADIAKIPCPPAPTFADPTHQYAAICTAFEAHVSRVRCRYGLKGVHQSQCGRGQTLERTFHKPQIVAVKTGRMGDYQPTVHTWTLTQCRWVTQCRRLQHYVKHLRKNSCTSTAMEHRVAIWRSIVCAAGFPRGFEHWWSQQVALDASLYPCFPSSPPSLELAQHIAQVFSQQLAVIAKRIATAKANRAKDVNRVFRDVRKPMPVPVSMLVAKSVAHVIEVVDEGSVVVDNSDAIQTASVLETMSSTLRKATFGVRALMHLWMVILWQK